MKLRKLVCLSGIVTSVFVAALPSSAAVIVFKIKAGTGQGNWNKPESAVHVAVGDILRIINEDNIIHALHTDDGRPCEHGEDMQPGGRYDCVINESYDVDTEGPLHDHYATEAKFWVVAQ